MKEIPEPVFSCLINHSERGTNQQHKPQPAPERWELTVYRFPFCRTADTRGKVGRCRGHGKFWQGGFIVDFRASLRKKKIFEECLMFSPHSPEIRDRRKRTKALRVSVRFPVGGAGVGVILEGWSSAPRSCSQEAGCGTPGRRPGPSRPDWSPEGGWWEGTCPSLSHSAPTLCSYLPP